MNIIEARHITKSYKIGHREHYLSLRDSISNFGRQFFGGSKKEFLALEDISFDVREGECLGIIGHNGAGKSTILKILSRITPPTSGSIKMRGRVASLLEVGTGFHPELTGRENIYLNGSILGMRKEEIEKQFDAIVSFSGVEQFLETPLKHYSNGMQLRLAFGVAAHLEPEILIIDEVLAVGDAEFQKKCLQKMDDVSQSGRTIVFVSHDMLAVRRLCNECILLEKGKIIEKGKSDNIINSYEKRVGNDIEHQINSLNTDILNMITIDGFSLEVKGRKITTRLTLNGEINRITSIVYPIYSSGGQRISLVDLRDGTLPFINNENNLKNITIESIIDVSHFVEGTYSLAISVQVNHNYWAENKKISFSVDPNEYKKYTPYLASDRGFFETDAQTKIIS